MDILITIPKKTNWKTYLKECEEALEEDPEVMLNYRIGLRFPWLVARGRTRCFIVHNGFIRGYHYVHDIKYIDGFTCMTTGVYWTPGYYIVRKGPFHPITPIQHKGFQGWRYYHWERIAA